MRLKIQPYNYQSNFKARIKIAQPSNTTLAKVGLLSIGAISAVTGNTTSMASYMDQSVHNPVLGSENLPVSYLKSAEQSTLQQSAYDILYRPYRLGNETALIPATLISSGANSFTSTCIGITNKFFKG